MASLTTHEPPEVNVAIACAGNIAVVSASVGAPETRHSVALSGPVELESVLALAERAVAQLLADEERSVPVVRAAPTEASRALDARAQKSPEPAPEPANARPLALPARAGPSLAAAVTSNACAQPVGDHSLLRAEFALESWSARAAAGVALGLEQDAARWTYAFIAGVTRPLQQPSLSNVTEWTTTGELGWHGNPWGIRLSGRLGLSLLSVDPENGVTTSSGALKSAAFIEADVSRPVWLGRFGLGPGLGLRFFSAKRMIAIEGNPEVELSTPSARVFLTIFIRVSD